MRVLLLLGAIGIYYFFFSDYSGCDKYASTYSCDHVENKATYDVYYWRNVYQGNPKDERFIGSTVGIRSCRDLARSHSVAINDEWTERSYICMLKRDGRGMEKHRYIF
ncbi:MAG: hypothetical protein RLZZ133_1669 [Pseudomonadota bacterium]|jgi:hypothetical protein